MSAEHQRLDSRAKSGSAQPYAARSAGHAYATSGARGTVLTIQIPDVTPSRVDNRVAKRVTQIESGAPAAAPLMAPEASDIETTEGDSTPRRWTDFFLQPQAALAGVVFIVALLAGVVLLSLRGGDNRATPPDTRENGAQARQADHADDVPRAALRTNVFPVEQTAGDQTPDNQTSFRNPREHTSQTSAGEGELTTGETMPNRPINVGQGPLAGIEAENPGQALPNMGARLFGQDEKQGVAELKGTLQHQIMAEANDERDRPGLR